MYIYCNISTFELIIPFLSHRNTAYGAETDAENTSTKFSLGLWETIIHYDVIGW